MKSIIKSFDELPKIVKIIFALPGLDIIWAIYRLLRSLSKNNILGIILAVIMLFVCPAIFWIIDIITIICANKVVWID